MFTVCPKCALTLVVTAADLRVAQGYVRCGRCLNVFNALARLSEERPSAAPTPPPEPAPAPSPPQPASNEASALDASQPAQSSLEDTGEIEIELDASIVMASTQAQAVPEETAEHEALAQEAATPLDSTVLEASAPAGNAEPEQPAPATPPLPQEATAEPAAALGAEIPKAAHREGGAAGSDEPSPPGSGEGAAPPPASGLSGGAEATAQAAAPQPAAPEPQASEVPVSRPAAAEPDASASEVAASQTAAPEAPEAHETNTPPPEGELAFELRGRGSRAGLAWSLGAVALVIVLALQIVNHYRDALAANPALRAPLSAVYSALGVKLVPHWNIHAYDVRQLGASVAGTAGGKIIVRASVKNSASRAQPLPLLRVTLQDRFGNRIAARDVPPSGYLPSPAASSALLAAGSRVDATMVFVDPGPQAVGFEIDACLRQRGGAVACAHGP